MNCCEKGESFFRQERESVCSKLFQLTKNAKNQTSDIQKTILALKLKNVKAFGVCFTKVNREWFHPTQNSSAGCTSKMQFIHFHSYFMAVSYLRFIITFHIHIETDVVNKCSQQLHLMENIRFTYSTLWQFTSLPFPLDVAISFNHSLHLARREVVYSGMILFCISELSIFYSLVLGKTKLVSNCSDTPYTKNMKSV